MWMCKQGATTCTLDAETSTSDYAGTDDLVLMAAIYGTKGATMTGIFDNEDVDDFQKV